MSFIGLFLLVFVLEFFDKRDDRAHNQRKKHQ